MKNADFRGGEIAVLEKAQRLALKSRHLCRLLRVHVSSCFALIFWGFHGVFEGFDSLRRLWRQFCQKQARRTSYPLHTAFSSPVLGTSAVPIHLVFVPFPPDRLPHPGTKRLPGRPAGSDNLSIRDSTAMARSPFPLRALLSLSHGRALGCAELGGILGAWFKPRLQFRGGWGRRPRATAPDPRLALGLASCCQLDPSHPALVTRRSGS